MDYKVHLDEEKRKLSGTIKKNNKKGGLALPGVKHHSFYG